MNNTNLTISAGAVFLIVLAALLWLVPDGRTPSIEQAAVAQTSADCARYENAAWRDVAPMPSMVRDAERALSHDRTPTLWFDRPDDACLTDLERIKFDAFDALSRMWRSGSRETGKAEAIAATEAYLTAKMRRTESMTTRVWEFATPLDRAIQMRLVQLYYRDQRLDPRDFSDEVAQLLSSARGMSMYSDF